MDTKIRRELRLLKLYTLCSLVVMAILVLAAFRRPSAAGNTKFEEIAVERINVVEKDGKLRLVIANRARLPDPVIGVKSYRCGAGPALARQA